MRTANVQRIWLWAGNVANSSERDGEQSDSKKSGKSLGQLCNYELLCKDYAWWI
jgi:hypothetical protein